MGRRSVNTTKSGKYMNPTDQARKEARRKELKKNKRQRMTVRMAVLKSKDPQQLLEEIEKIDQQEYDPTQPPQLNERVLKEKRKKLKETYDRVMRMYEREDPEFALDMKKAEAEFDQRKVKMQIYFEQVKNAEKVKIDMIPLPEVPSLDTTPSNIPLPSDIPLPSLYSVRSKHGILKKISNYDRHIGPSTYNNKTKNPPGPPPGSPPHLDEDDDNPIHNDRNSLDDDADHSIIKKKKIRFHDDDTRDPDEEEKDTRIKFKTLSPSNQGLQNEPNDKQKSEVPITDINSQGLKVIPPGPPPIIYRLPPPMLPPHIMPPGQSRLRPPNVPPLGLTIRTPVPPPGLPQGIQGPNLPSSLKSLTQNNILSAPPSYAKTSSIAEKSHPSSGSKSEISVTISAKPKIRNLIGDVTRFTPIAVKIKREVKDIKGQAVKSGKSDENASSKLPSFTVASSQPTKDDAYETFMKEMQDLL